VRSLLVVVLAVSRAAAATGPEIVAEADGGFMRTIRRQVRRLDSTHPGR
jgi:hypothetical protein